MATRVVPRRDAKAPHHTWHYYQRGFDEPVKAQSYDDLVEAVVKFRVDNNLDMGDPDADVDAYTQSNTPGYRKKLPTKPLDRPAPKRSDQRTFIDKVRTWTKLSRQKPWRIEPLELAQERAAICLKCPENTPTNAVSKCSPCIKALNRDVIILTNNKSVSSDLGVCAAVFHHNKIAVLAPVEQLTRSLELVEETPKACWLRTINA